MNASTAAGLSDNLDDLAKLVDQEDDREGQDLNPHLVQV